MANGYIGKISAVVTANTSDLSRKLQGAVKDVDRFAQTLNRSVSASAQQATASLEKIFTPLQRLERKLKTALQLNLRTDDEVRKIQQLVSVAEGINKPLERASGAFSKLSLEVQGSFLPALNRAQDAAVNLSNTLQQQGSVSANSFKQVEATVDRTTKAIQRLTQAQQLASQSFTGNELQFGNPRLFETLSANARTTQRAAALPASALVDGDIARQVRALEQYQNAAVEAAARVESLRLEPNVRPEVLIAAERRLENIIETARRAGQELSKVVDRDANAANAKRVEDAENVALVRREQARKALDQQLAASAKQRADAEISALVKREQAALRLEGQLAAAAKQREDAELAAIQRREQAALRLDQQLAASAKKAADDEIAALVKKEQSAIRIENQLTAAAKQRVDEEISALTKREGTALRLENQLAAAARQREEAEQSALNKREQTALRLENQLAAAARQREEAEQSALNKKEQTALRLENQLAAAAKQRADAEVNAVVKAEQARKRLAQQLADNDPAQRVRQREIAEGIERQRRDEELAVMQGRREPLRGVLAEQGRRRVQGLTGDTNIDSGDRFGGQSQRDIDALASRVGAVRQQLETLPNAVRTRFVPELQRAQQELIRLQNAPAATVQQIENAANEVQRLEQTARRANQALALPAAGDALEASAVRGFTGQLEAAQRVLIQVGETAGGPVTRAYERLRASQQRFIEQGTAGTPRATRAIERLQQALARAAADTGRISFSRALREVQRGGDIARGAFGNAQLAIQQGIFAVDDFFSVTGGLEQRLRAVGNNVTQLGFLIGGTTGLFVGLAAVLGGQVLLAINRFAFGSQEAEDAAKSLNTALDNQRSQVQQLAQDYARLAAEIAKSVEAENGGGAGGRRREVEERRRAIREAAIETIAANSPSLAGVRGQQDRARQRREEAVTPGDQISAASEERAAARRRTAAERVAFGQSQRLADEFQARQAAGGPSARLAINAEINNLQREIERIRSNRGFFDLFATAGADTAPLRERISRLRGAETIVQQGEAESFLQRGQRFAARAAGGLDGVVGFSATQERLNGLFSDFEKTLQGITDGTLSPREVELANERFAALSATLDVAIATVGGFAKALEDGARQLADTVVQELRGREDQARRAANAAEAEFGPGSSQARTARRDERLIAAERRRAEERRQGIDEEISRRRRQFEEDALAGRGRSEDVDRAKEIARQRQIEEDQTRSVADREEARLRRQRLELEQQQSFEGRREVQQLRSQADQGDVEAQRRIQEIEGAARAREQARSEVERRRLEIQSAARDLGAGQRLGDLGPAQIQQAGINLAQSVAPAFAQLRDELLNARLQGPSRAALTVADVNTAEGSRELNRLIRGDDSARDVNLVELQTQSRLLEEIKVAIQAETAVVVDL